MRVIWSPPANSSATVTSADRRYLLRSAAHCSSCIWRACTRHWGWRTVAARCSKLGLLNYLWPMLTLVLSIPLLHTRPTLGLIPGVVLAMAGIVLATMQHQPLAWTVVCGQHLTHNSAPYLLGASAAWRGGCIRRSAAAGPAAHRATPWRSLCWRRASFWGPRRIFVCRSRRNGARRPRSKWCGWRWPRIWPTSFGIARCATATSFWSRQARTSRRCFRPSSAASTWASSPAQSCGSDARWSSREPSSASWR